MFGAIHSSSCHGEETGQAGEGKRTKDIAAVLIVSVKIVEFHKARLMEQLNLYSTPALIKFAITEGLARAESGLF